MRILSIHAGQLKPLTHLDHPDYKSVLSGIEKVAVSSAGNPAEISITPMGVKGDEQADAQVHGGLEKALYAYPSEHYLFWTELLKNKHGTPAIQPGLVGENLSVRGFQENDVWVGDRWFIGSGPRPLVLRVTQLREPCFKLNARLRYSGAAKAMVQSSKSGWYLAVEEPGVIRAGDEIQVEAGARHTNIKMQNEFLLKKNVQKDLF